MRLLLVEDDVEVIDVFQTEFPAGGHAVAYASARDDALALLDESYDAVVCDLRLPSRSDTFDEDVAHGRAVLMTLLESCPGTPVVAFSAYGTVELMQELMKSARQEDFLGEAADREMLIFFTKDQLLDCIAWLHDLAESIAVLDSIEIATGTSNLTLTWEHDRIVRIYARRLGATVVRAAPLAGGLSGSRVLRLRLEAAGAHVASVVAKLDTLDVVASEHRGVVTLVAPVLESGAYPSAVTLIRAGAGECGGLFYRFAGGFEASLFDVLADDLVAEVVGRLRGLLSPWLEGAPVEETSLGQIRERLIYLDDLPEVDRDAVIAADLTEISARRSTGHCDLHVFNVLVSDSGSPMVIDFGAVGPGASAIDPVTLELSVLFHPDAREFCGAWPSIAQAENWDNLEQFIDGSPSPTFIRECRGWAFDVAAGDREVFAALYSYGLRQLRFDPEVHPVARALVSCARRRLGL